MKREATQDFGFDHDGRDVQGTNWEYRSELRGKKKPEIEI